MTRRSTSSAPRPAPKAPSTPARPGIVHQGKTGGNKGGNSVVRYGDKKGK